MSLRADLEALSFSTLGDHFSETFTWATGAGTVQFRATRRTGIPDSPRSNPSALHLYVEPAQMPAGAAKKDIVTINGQDYTVTEIQRRDDSFTGVSLELKK